MSRPSRPQQAPRRDQAPKTGSAPQTATHGVWRKVRLIGGAALALAAGHTAAACDVPASCDAAIGLAFAAEPPAVRVRMQQIAWRESHDQPDVVNASGHTGCLQLAPIHAARAARLGFTWADMRRAWPNAVVAHDLYLDAGFTPWRTR